MSSKNKTPGDAPVGLHQQVWVRGAKGPSGEFGAEGRVTVCGDAWDVYGFISRVEEQPKWNKGVKTSRVVAVDGRVSQVHQSLKWNFLAIGGEFTMHLFMKEDPEKLHIHTSLQKGSLMRKFHSDLSVTPLHNPPSSSGPLCAPGKSPKHCQVEMTLFMQPRVYVPFGIRHLVTTQVQNQLKGVLQGLKEHLESEEYLAAAAAGGDHGGKGFGGAAAAGGLGRSLGFGTGSWPSLDIAPLKVQLASLSPSLGALDGMSVRQAARGWADSWHRSAVPHLQQLAAGLGSLQR